MTKNILLLWDRMGDYHRARWYALQSIIGKEHCYAADLGAGDGLYQWANTNDTHYFRLSEKPVEQVSTQEAFNRFKAIVRSHNITHVCIPGYGRPCYIHMLLWCRIKGIKVLMFAESWYPGNAIADLLKGWLVRATADACLVSGERAATHFTKRLGFPESRIREGYSVVDNHHFASAINTPKITPPQLLCVARFANEKNLEILVEAFQQSDLCHTWQLRLVGGGPLKEQLLDKVNHPNIHLDNWLGYEQLPQMYAQASCFILPSSFEPWGLVVNEAMAAGLPIILSDAVGAAPDLLENGKNGWVFAHNNLNELIDRLNTLATLPTGRLAEMGKLSKEMINNFSPNTWANQIVDICGFNQAQKTI
jgi:1,2-diacylglycerol 3-alpha-glucosyltransferase